MLRIAICALLGAALFGVALTSAGAIAQPASALPAWRRDGQVIWTKTPDGRIKARAYTSDYLTVRPVLVVWLHGDLGPGSEPYEVAQHLAAMSDNVVAAAILRPGYADAEGDLS